MRHIMEPAAGDSRPPANNQPELPVVISNLVEALREGLDRREKSIILAVPNTEAAAVVTWIASRSQTVPRAFVAASISASLLLGVGAVGAAAWHFYRTDQVSPFDLLLTGCGAAQLSMALITRIRLAMVSAR
jgi:hypothetical protein